MILLHRHYCSSYSIEGSNIDGHSHLNCLSLIKECPTPLKIFQDGEDLLLELGIISREPQTISPQHQMTCPLSPLWSAQRSSPARKSPPNTWRDCNLTPPLLYWGIAPISHMPRMDPLCWQWWNDHYYSCLRYISSVTFWQVYCFDDLLDVYRLALGSDLQSHRLILNPHGEPCLPYACYWWTSDGTT